MNVALRNPMTLAEFLEWEERQELRYEFDGVGPVAMIGGTFAHAAIQRNPEIGVELPLVQLYEGLAFETQPEFDPGR